MTSVAAPPRRSRRWHPDVLKRVPGLTYRRLDYWARTGVLRPEREAAGSGTRRSYSEDDIRCLKVVDAASRCGVCGETLAKLVETVRANPEARFALIHPGPRDALLAPAWNGAVELLRDGPVVTSTLVLVVPIDATGDAP